MNESDEQYQMWFMLSERDLRKVLGSVEDRTMGVDEVVSELVLAATFHDFTDK